MDRLSFWCQMCGAAPGEPCTVISGSGGDGDRPGDVRPDPHWHRSATERPGVLVPDEPPFGAVHHGRSH